MTNYYKLTARTAKEGTVGFNKKLAAFTELVHALDATDQRVMRLQELLLALKPQGVENTINGPVYGTSIQLGTVNGDLNLY